MSVDEAFMLTTSVQNLGLIDKGKPRYTGSNLTIRQIIRRYYDVIMADLGTYIY